MVAGRFILTAVQRKDLGEAWKLVGPGIRQGMTYKEWLKGTIPVVPFLDAIKLAPMKVDLSEKNHAILEVILIPVSKDGEAADLHARREQGREGEGRPLGRQLVGAAVDADHPEQPEQLAAPDRQMPPPARRRILSR